MLRAGDDNGLPKMNNNAFKMGFSLKTPIWPLYTIYIDGRFTIILKKKKSKSPSKVQQKIVFWISFTYKRPSIETMLSRNFETRVLSPIPISKAVKSPVFFYCVNAFALYKKNGNGNFLLTTFLFFFFFPSKLCYLCLKSNFHPNATVYGSAVT